MQELAVVGAILYFVLMFLCMKREKKLSGFYSAIGVCGRWYGLIAGYCMLFVPACPIMLVMTLLQNEGGAGQAWIDGLMIVGVSAAMAFLGYYMYRRAAKKCSEQMRKRLLWDMLVIALGATFRLSLFIMYFLLKTWWLLDKPKVYSVDGRTVYAYPGSADLYDEYGRHVGKLADFGGTAIMD